MNKQLLTKESIELASALNVSERQFVAYLAYLAVTKGDFHIGRNERPDDKAYKDTMKTLGIIYRDDDGRERLADIGWRFGFRIMREESEDRTSLANYTEIWDEELEVEKQLVNRPATIECPACYGDLDCEVCEDIGEIPLPKSPITFISQYVDTNGEGSWHDCANYVESALERAQRYYGK